MDIIIYMQASNKADKASISSPPSSQNDFMRQIDLVQRVQPPPQQPQMVSGRHCRLWNPEQEQESEDLWSFNQVFQGTELILESSCNDPTLMEVEASEEAAAEEASTSVSDSERVESEAVLAADPNPFRCDGCERTLASRELYQKHLLSELHFKRTSSTLRFEAPEKDAIAMTTTVDEVRKRKRNPKYDDDQVENEGIESKRRAVVAAEAAVDGIITCESCHTRVNAPLFGKHLISHFHHHRSKLPSNHPAAQRLVLRHIEEIVLLAPFQCEPCRFFCNWENEFLRHWQSDAHLEAVGRSEDAYWDEISKNLL
jgi:hypothetical protein